MSINVTAVSALKAVSGVGIGDNMIQFEGKAYPLHCGHCKRPLGPVWKMICPDGHENIVMYTPEDESPLRVFHDKNARIRCFRCHAVNHTKGVSDAERT